MGKAVEVLIIASQRRRRSSPTTERIDMISHSFLITAHVCLFLITLSATSSVWAHPVSSERYNRLAVVSRQTTTVQPYFPDTPPSCPICAKGYPSINSCAQAAPALPNFTSVCVSFLPGLSPLLKRPCHFERSFLTQGSSSM